MAEVLITLTIIGIIAAMTIPTLMVKYQKQVTVTQLKIAYSTLAQAFRMAQSEHGDPSGWDIFSPENNEDETLKASLTSFVETYLFPYLKTAEDCGAGEKASRRCNYDAYLLNGEKNSDFSSIHKYQYKFIINKIMPVYIALSNVEGDFTKTNKLLIQVDINGMKKPNTQGKDIFTMQFTTNSQLSMYGQGYTRTQLKDYGVFKCDKEKEGKGSFCGALIQYDGWQIKDDYPW